MTKDSKRILICSIIWNNLTDFYNPPLKKNQKNYNMKKFLLLIFTLCITFSFAQSTSQPPVQNISSDSSVVFRLFSTKNMYTFIKLDTRNGQMWQVQWDTGGNQLETPLSLLYLVSEEREKNGRFFLYPTTNIYNFILMDQIDGRVWQVQWSTEAKQRMIVPIRSN